MKKKSAAHIYLAGALGIILLTAWGWRVHNEPKVLKVVASNYWGALSPPQQSTSMADTLLGNAFEPLVDLSSSGSIIPGAAESWAIDDDGRGITFRLRSNVKFSDGTKVTANDFVRSWLDASKMNEIDSANHNTLDVLHKIKGFSAHKKESKVSGLSAIDDRILRVEFNEPFRTALFELTGTRYAAWKISSGAIIGSGRYKIDEHIPKKLIRFRPNPYSPFESAFSEIIVEGFENAWLEMKSGMWDLYLGQDPDGQIPDHLTLTPGGYVGHQNIEVSGLPDSIFRSPELRLAIQYIIHRKVLPSLTDSLSDQADVDPQVYPPLWKGRLSDYDAKILVDSGEKHVVDLVESSKRKPIVFRFKNPIAAPILEELKKLGIHFTEESHVPLTGSEFLKFAYGKAPFDLLYVGANVVGNDPDSIFHLLGEFGALNNPQIFRKEVSDLLRDGRSLTIYEDLDTHYRRVSKAILQTVPLVHLRYLRNSIFYNSQRAGFRSVIENSDRFNFDNINTN